MIKRVLAFKKEVSRLPPHLWIIYLGWISSKLHGTRVRPAQNSSCHTVWNRKSFPIISATFLMYSRLFFSSLRSARIIVPNFAPSFGTKSSHIARTFTSTSKMSSVPLPTDYVSLAMSSKRSLLTIPAEQSSLPAFVRSWPRSPTHHWWWDMASIFWSRADCLGELDFSGHHGSKWIHLDKQVFRRPSRSSLLWG